MKIKLEKYNSEYEQHYHMDNHINKHITNVYMYLYCDNHFKNCDKHFKHTLYRDSDSKNDISKNTYWKT